MTLSLQLLNLLGFSGLKGFPDSSVGKEATCDAGDLGSIPGLGRSPGDGKGYPLQYSGLENSLDCTVHGGRGVGHNWATFTLPFHSGLMSTTV